MTDEKTCVVYGASWCGDTRRSKAFLDSRGIPYEWHDIDEEPEHVDTVIGYAGKRKIPVIVFEDGSCLIEPADVELAEKLGL